jgi:hypothetical protein
MRRAAGLVLVGLVSFHLATRSDGPTPDESEALAGYVQVAGLDASGTPTIRLVPGSPRAIDALCGSTRELRALARAARAAFLRVPRSQSRMTKTRRRYEAFLGRHGRPTSPTALEAAERLEAAYLAARAAHRADVEAYDRRANDHAAALEACRGRPG